VRAPSPRRLTYLGLAGWGAAIAVTTALLSINFVSPAGAVMVIFDAAVLLALAAMFGMAVRADQRADRLVRALERLVRDDERRAAHLTTALEKLDAHVGSAREWVSQDVFSGYRQLEAMVDLRALINPKVPLPPLRGWALSPDALRLIVREISGRQPQLIVECGSGSSTVWLGYTVQRVGTGRVVALEHDERFVALSRELLRAHGLEDVVEIRYAPLVPWQGGTGAPPWYDVRAVEDLEKIGLLLVDGPPGTIGPDARYPALPVLLPKCAEGTLILLDDTVRDQETAVSDRWLAEYPELRRTVHDFEKGLHAFERTPHG
jgi:predicted O-methyltransferase YrrM